MKPQSNDCRKRLHKKSRINPVERNELGYVQSGPHNKHHTGLRKLYNIEVFLYVKKIQRQKGRAASAGTLTTPRPIVPPEYTRESHGRFIKTWEFHVVFQRILGATTLVVVFHKSSITRKSVRDVRRKRGAYGLVRAQKKRAGTPANFFFTPLGSVLRKSNQKAKLQKAYSARTRILRARRANVKREIRWTAFWPKSVRNYKNRLTLSMNGNKLKTGSGCSNSSLNMGQKRGIMWSLMEAKGIPQGVKWGMNSTPWVGSKSTFDAIGSRRTLKTTFGFLRKKGERLTPFISSTQGSSSSPKKSHPAFPKSTGGGETECYRRLARKETRSSSALSMWC